MTDKTDKGPMADMAITLVRGWARAELDAGCVLSPWSEARDRTVHALALYGIDAAVIEANEQRIASAWEGAKLAHDTGVAWVAKICMEREELQKQLASIKSQEGLLSMQQRRANAQERRIKDLEIMHDHRCAEIRELKKELAKLKKELAELEKEAGNG